MSHPVAAGAIPVRAEDLLAWGIQALTQLDMPEADARLLTESLVQTSLWGVDSHGIARLPHYLDRLQRGSIKARPAVRIEQTAAGTAQLHADQGHGIVIAFQAMELAMKLAREAGIGAVGVSDASHCGAIGLYARAAARQGYVALAFTHADKVAVPHQGERAYFGTNPIAIAFPRAGGADGAPAEPVCLDMATTSIPWNRVVNARREGHPLPQDVAVDAQGLPTTNAEAARAVTPLGGESYGHKGYALALMVDLLCGPLNANPFGPHIPSMFGDLDAPRRLGAFFIVIDPQRFAGGAVLAATVALMASELTQEPGSPRMPGDPEADHARERRTHGIPIEPGLAEQFRDWGVRLGRPVDFLG